MNSTIIPKTCTSPFTATQWQELEHQALIFKYMVSGIPIPPDLIFSVRRSLESSISAKLFPHQPIGWGCFEMGFGRKTDPEPGRCRRTDGKKWRCSKEAYTDSKYCEKHMHRGRNRSRKPVEISSKPTTNQITPPPLNLGSTRTLSASTPTSSSYSLSTLSSSSSSSLTCETQSYHQAPAAAAASSYHESSIHPFPYYPQSSSSRPPCSDFSPNNTNPQLFLYSGTHYQADKDYRDINGQREDVGVQAFFPSVADSTRNLGEVYSQPIGMDSYKGFSQSVSQSHQIYNSKQSRQQQEQHCFVLGTDFNKSSKTKEEEEDAETQKPLLHFFEDCPPKNSDSWLDLASNSSIHGGNFIGL